jgi:signal transduction histidine kinase
LRTPLTPIMGWATLMRQVGGGSPEMMVQAFEAIERNAELLKRLVSDLLDTTRLAAGKMHTEKNWCDLNQIAQMVAQSIEGQMVENGVRLECSFGADVPPLALDRDRIQQVLMNLLSNAAKFSSTGGTIYLRTRCEPCDKHQSEHQGERQSGAPQPEMASSSTRGHASENRASENRASPDVDQASGTNRCVVIEVEDQGIGITPELLPHVFDMFRQGDSSYSRRHGGLGLGLSISKSLVEMHGGTLSAHSDGDGQGALFVVTLPV